LAEGAPQYIREGIPSEHLKDIQDLDVTALQPPADLECTLLELLKSPNIASKAWYLSSMTTWSGQTLLLNRVWMLLWSA